MTRLLLFLIGYGCGLFETSWIVGRRNGIDIRTRGSGNAGATNALRVLGNKAGIAVFFGDMLKCLIPCLIVRAVFTRLDPDHALIYMVITGFGVIVGHDFPFYLHFHGGKGISATSALVFITHPIVCITAVAGWFIPVLITRYVSLGSLIAVLGYFFSNPVLAVTGRLPILPGEVGEYMLWVTLITGLACERHSKNIRRLLAGTENKISFHHGQKAENPAHPEKG